MANRVQKDLRDCSCGRTAQWIGAISGEPECWELIDLRRHWADKKILWKDYYPGQEARHSGKDEA